MSISFITNEQLYKQVIEPVAGAASFVWIGTADINDLHVHYRGAIMKQFDEVWMGKYCKNCKRKEFCNDPII